MEKTDRQTRQILGRPEEAYSKGRFTWSQGTKLAEFSTTVFLLGSWEPLRRLGSRVTRLPQINASIAINKLTRHRVAYFHSKVSITNNRLSQPTPFMPITMVNEIWWGHYIS